MSSATTIMCNLNKIISTVFTKNTQGKLSYLKKEIVINEVQIDEFLIYDLYSEAIHNN
mgnify:CR=1 FL=1